MPGFQIIVPPGYTVLDKSLLKKALRAAGNEIARRARQMIRAGGATKKRAANRISAAGQPPVSRTGNLARGIRVRPWRNGEGVTVKDTAAHGSAFYALFLEKGARGGVGSGKKGVKGKRNKRGGVVGTRVLPPHPFMGPALDQTIAAGLGDRVRDAIVQGIAFRRGSR